MYLKSIKLLTSLLVVLFFICGCQSQSLMLKQNEYIVEYGNDISFNAQEYLQNDDDILSRVKISSDVKKEKNKDYPAVGEYTLFFSFGNKTEMVKVIVKDTISPVFVNIKDKYDVELNSKFDSTQLKAIDLSEVTITVDDSEVDYNKVGDYKVKVIASDKYDNKAEKEITIVVKSEEKQENSGTSQYTEDSSVITSSTKKSSSIESSISSNISSSKSNVSSNSAGSSSIIAGSSSSGSSSSSSSSSQSIIDLDVPYINQYDSGAPMGCEAASLLEALHFKGYATQYNLESFLKEMPIAEDDNPYHGYSYTPYQVLSDDYYQSIFPEPLANWGKNYGNVSNISGSSISTIQAELKKGNPVVVYVTYNFQNAVWQKWWFGDAINNMHVMTVCGYNPQTGYYKVADPAKGVYWVSRSQFECCYNYLKWSVVVR